MDKNRSKLVKIDIVKNRSNLLTIKQNQKTEVKSVIFYEHRPNWTRIDDDRQKLG